MDTMILLETHSVLFYSLIAVLGLVIGSFLNVVIYRLPQILQADWRQQCQEFLQTSEASVEPVKYNLSFPASQCTQCKQRLAIWHNIPLFSFLLLRGHCAYCQTKISWRYPSIELLSAILSLWLAWHFGFSGMLAIALVFTWFLISLSFIDYDHQLLPDSLTLGLLWLGLLCSLSGLLTQPVDAIIGAAAAYSGLWGFSALFKIITKKQGMGHGDFKLFAAFGAVLGWQFLPLIIILASLTGAIWGIILMMLNKQSRNKAIPFGPFLAIAAWIALMWGVEINQAYLRFIGF